MFFSLSRIMRKGKEEKIRVVGPPFVSRRAAPAFPRSSANFRPKPARKFRAESKRKSPGFSSRPRQLTSLHLLVCPLVFPSRLISSLLPIVGTSRIKREQVPRYYTLWKIPRYYIEFRLDHREGQKTGGVLRDKSKKKRKKHELAAHSRTLGLGYRKKSIEGKGYIGEIDEVLLFSFFFPSFPFSFTVTVKL